LLTIITRPYFSTTTINYSFISRPLNKHVLFGAFSDRIEP